MRIIVAAIGRLKAGAETELAERYRKRAEQTGRNLGWKSVEIIEIRESKAGRRVTERRRKSIGIEARKTVPILVTRGLRPQSTGRRHARGPEFVRPTGYFPGCF